MMVGRDVMLKVDKGPAKPGDVVLDVNNLHVSDDMGHTAVKGVSFQVHAGEIVGVAGVQGNGQTELVEALTGLQAVDAGHVTIMGQDVTNATPRRILDQGVAHVPEDRQADGLVLSFPVTENLILDMYGKEPYASGGILHESAINESARELIDEFDVRTPGIMTPVGNLSGGNQQKVIVAREFSRPIHLLIASQPTRGIDVGSIEYIHQRIVEKRDQGCAVLLVSSELDEIMSLSDRIAVMYEGQIVDVVDAASTTREEIGLMMAGARKETNRA